MKRRNVDINKLRRPIKRNKITESFYGSNTVLYMKFLTLWILVILADFILEFRFEFLWPFYLLLRSVYDSYRYQGVAFSVLFVGVALTSDLLCYFFIPVHWLLFAASTYVWVQYVWHTERGVCAPTVMLWALFVYMEAAVRLRDHKHMPGHLDLCRPFAAHCIGYPVVTLGFGFKSYVGYRMRRRRQRDVSKENDFYLQLMQQALPPAEAAPLDSGVAAMVAQGSSSAQANANTAQAHTKEHNNTPSSQNNFISSCLPSLNTNHTHHKPHNSNTSVTSHRQQNGCAATGTSMSASTPQLSITSSSTVLSNGSVSNGSAGGKHSRKSSSHNSSNSVASAGVYSRCNGVLMLEASVSSNGGLHSAAAATMQMDTTAAIATESKCSPSCSTPTSVDHHSNRSEISEIATSAAATVAVTGNVLGGSSGSCGNAHPGANSKAAAAANQQAQAQRRKEQRREQQEREKERRELDRMEREEKEYMQRYERLRSELTISRTTESELRSQLSSLTASERQARAECAQLQRDADEAQTRAHQAQAAARTHAHAHLQQVERRVVEERRARQQAEQHVAGERKLRKAAELARQQAEQQLTHAQQQVHAQAQHNRGEQTPSPTPSPGAAPTTTIIQQCSDACRQRRRDLEQEISDTRQRVTWQEERGAALEREAAQAAGERARDGELLVAALAALQDKNTHLETTLSAETRIKMDLLMALGEAKRQLEIKDLGLRAQEKEIDELKSKIAQVLAVMPNDTFSSGVSPPSNAISRHVRLTESPPSVGNTGLILQQQQHPHLLHQHHHLLMSQMQQQQQQVQMQQQQQHMTVGGGMGGAISPGSTLDPNATAYTPKGVVVQQQQQQQQPQHHNHHQTTTEA